MHAIIFRLYNSIYFLKDILSKEDTCLDYKLVTSLSLDLVNGMIYLHDSQLGFHGNLKSSNCLIDSNWTLKITNFGLKHIRNATKPLGMTERDYFSKHYASPLPPWSYFEPFLLDLLWSAPELLRNPSVIDNPEGDVYSFAIVLHELVCRQGPFAVNADLGDPIST